MMQSVVKTSLRLAILIMVALPLVLPFIEKTINKQPPKIVPVWVDINLRWTDQDKGTTERIIREKLSVGSDVRFNFRRYGSLQQTPVQDYEELLSQLNTFAGEQIVITAAELWGPAARNVRRELEQHAERSTDKIWVLMAQSASLKPRRQTPSRFLALSEISAPQLNFLGESSQLSLDIVGRLDAGESQTVEVVIRSGESLLTSKSLTITADSSGLVNSIENIPIHFTRAQQQLLTAQLSSELSPVPLNMASTPVSVVHSKSTVLHIGVGPDWSLRNMRTKLKFWPNLDLLSYYILREVSDDLTIPSNQLSLIEFPAEKLFGEQLPNFHGVLAQNFVFDSYLNPQDTQNLFDYVNDKGGRLVLQAGPLSFLGRDSKITELFPCENLPTFDFETAHAWRVGQNRFLSEANFEAAVAQVVTKQTALGCKPKEGALVLAETNEDPPSPMILAYPVGKGLVVAILAGDWQTFASQWDAQSATQRARRVYGVDASERLFQWMVEFLQRRQDSGLRPPQFAGPRLYLNDPLHLVRSRGGIPENSRLRANGHLLRGLVGRPTWLPGLELEAAQWDRWNATENSSNSLLAGAVDEAQDRTQAPTFQSVGLTWHTQNPEEIIKTASTDAQRQLVWPVFEGTTRQREGFVNPALIPERLTRISPEFSRSLSQAEESRERKIIPLLNAYPWLLGLALFLLTIDQLLARLVFAPSQPRVPDRQ